MSARKTKQTAVEREDARDTVTTKRILIDCLGIIGITGLTHEDEARLVDVADYLRDRLRRSGAAAVNVADAPNVEGARSCPAAGSGALAWTVEKPRASGMWWWWNLDPKCAPDMVEVRASDVLRWCGLGPTMHWPGLTRVRNVMTVGGVWAGPVNPPETPSEPLRPNDKLTHGATP